MADLLLEIPKAELHLHLEGSVEPETLHELDPATPVEEFRSLYSYTDFDAFLRAFGAIGKRLRTPEDYALITRRLLERLAAGDQLVVFGRSQSLSDGAERAQKRVKIGVRIQAAEFLNRSGRVEFVQGFGLHRTFQVKVQLGFWYFEEQIGHT